MLVSLPIFPISSIPICNSFICCNACSSIISCRRNHILVIVTDSTATDVDVYMATSLREHSNRSSCAVILLVVSHHLAIARNSFIEQSVAHRTQTTTAIDRAKHCTTRDFQSYATSHVTGRVGITAETTTATKDVTIHVGGTPSTNLRTNRDRILWVCIIHSILNIHRHITQHVTILTATEGRAIYPSARDIYLYIVHIGLFVEQYTWVTLTTTEQIASNRVSSNLTKRTRHTDSTTRHIDSTLTCHIGQFVSSIDIGQDMSALDIHYGVATHITSLPVPFTCSVWEVTRAATKDIAIEGTSVITYSTTSLGFITIGIYIVDSIFVSCSLSILPTCAFRQRTFITIYIFQFTISPFCFRITAVKAISFSSWQVLTCSIHLHITATNLAIIFYGYMRVMLHESLLSTTKDITLHEGISTNSDICLGSQSQRLNKLQINVFSSFTIVVLAIVFVNTPWIIPMIAIFIDIRCSTLAGTKNMTCVIRLIISNNIPLFINMEHRHVIRTDFSIASYGDNTIATIRIFQ